MDTGHVPVMLKECIEGLKIRPDGIYVDGTLGRAGHSLAIAEKLTTGRLIAIDRDDRAIAAGEEVLRPYRDKVEIVRANFSEVDSVLDKLGIDRVDGMLFDLGVSSPQLDDSGSGFSYMTDSPLDMRMDRRDALTACEIVNNWPETELRQLLFRYGEEKYAKGIARRICQQREQAPIETTHQLVELIRKGMPASALREKQHPAKRTFQAIRIAVNDELGAISALFEAAVPKLAPGGRIVVISFHSLEDRIVKNAISDRENGCTCPNDFPVCICGFVPSLKAVKKKAIMPTEQEVAANPRARSAKLRIAQKV